MKREVINPIDYVKTVLEAMPQGILVTVKDGVRVNPMTIGWGKIGIEWGKLIFTTYIRTGRFTHTLLENSGVFTVNIPIDDSAKKILSVCGTQSGRDVNKVEKTGITLVEGEKVDCPGIKELPLTFECKVIYKQLQDINAMPEEIINRYYPQNKPTDFAGSNRDMHTMFYGEIVHAYIIK